MWVLLVGYFNLLNVFSYKLMGALDQASECVKRAVVTVSNRVPREKHRADFSIKTVPLFNP